MKEIPLTHNKVALVDDAYYELVNAYRWFAHKGYKNNWYACRWIPIAKDKYKMVSMHNFIMNTPKGMETDHKDGDGLNNQRSNIRPCTHTENQHNQNIRIYPNKTSQFKGVSKQKKYTKWQSKIRVNNKVYWLGYFTSEIEAAKAYDKAALKYHGEFARLNFPEKEG